MTLRLKMLRKKLGLNQSEFGAVISLKQRTISEIESGAANLTERNFNAICEKFNVNPEWLRNGEGEMFLPDTVDTYLDKIVVKKKLSMEDKALIKSVLNLPPEGRKMFVDWAKQLVEEIYSQSTPKENERREIEKQMADLQARLDALDGKSYEDTPPYRMTTAQKRALVNHELDLEDSAAKRATASSVSNSTSS